MGKGRLYGRRLGKKGVREEKGLGGGERGRLRRGERRERKGREGKGWMDKIEWDK